MSPEYQTSLSKTQRFADSAYFTVYVFIFKSLIIMKNNHCWISYKHKNLSFEQKQLNVYSINQNLIKLVAINICLIFLLSLFCFMGLSKYRWPIHSHIIHSTAFYMVYSIFQPSLVSTCQHAVQRV